MLDARHLTKYYGASAAIRNVSFTLAPGGILGLLGPNGSGKSTTVSILAGLLEPSGGAVYFNGVSASEHPLDYKALIGYVPEEAHLYTYLTGAEYLVLVGQLREIPDARIHHRIAGLLDVFGLTDDQHTPMSAYSKGMRQKILLSAALLHDPQILILDEPNSGLDVTSSLLLRSVVRALARSGRIVIYSSHVVDIVEQVATDVLILQKGAVAAHGSVAELRTMMALPRLEDVFRHLVLDTDVEGRAQHVVDVMTS